VLEARDRIGGRIWTERVAGEVVDLGATWIHGTQGNPVAILAREWKLPLVETDWERRWFPAADAGQADYAVEKVERLYRISRKGAVSDIIPPEWRTDPMMRWAVRGEITGEYGEDPERLSLHHWRDDEDFPGGDWLLPRGYCEIADFLATGLDVRRSCVVRRIHCERNGLLI
jgi:predicted NAD/FAD-dependent oxidoreductase